MAKARKSQRGDRVARLAKIRELASIVRDAEPTPFALQAACTHGLRAELCLRGWPFQVAAAEADKLVKAALDLVGAKRPSWHEGQVEFVFGMDFTERTRCIRCGDPVPDERVKYCSQVCGDAHKIAMQRQRRGEEMRAMEQARQAAWRSQQPPQACEQCQRSFKPAYPGHRFCSVQCSNASRSGKDHPWKQRCAA